MKLRYFALGVIATLATLAVLGLGMVYLGLVPSNADATPGSLEQWLANTALDAYVRRNAPPGPNPVATNEASLRAGMQLFSDNCYGCHGKGDTSYYPPIPKFQHSFHDRDGEIFFVIKHGVRLTAMPSFQSSLKDEEIWQIVGFLKNLDQLPPDVKAEYEK